MNRIESVTTPLRSVRLRANAPRALAYALVAILCIAGLKSILSGSPGSAAAPETRHAPAVDRPAEAFAEGFARAYLNWDSAQPEEREHELAPYLPSSMESGAGLTPAAGSSQEVRWSTVTATRRTAAGIDVTVLAQTTNGSFYLTVPVARDRRGFLYVAGHPALVGAPPVQKRATPSSGEDVDDESLRTVATRALRNYLSGTRQNLYADLTSTAVVSLPARAMSEAEVGEITWIRQPDRIAVEVTAWDSSDAEWSLRYELEVRKRDRWYVQAIHDNPTREGN